VVRGEGLLSSLADLERVVVATRGGVPVYLREVATVELAPLLRQGAATRDGDREAVAGIVLMLLGENSRAVADRVDDTVSEIMTTLPEGVNIDTYYDRSDLVRRTLRTVATNLLEGGLLVVVILLLLIGSLRAGLLVAAAIPLSMLVAFSAMRWTGVSGNLMSLGAIDFGLIVDGAVVMVENILRVLHQRRGEPGVPTLEKVRAAAHQVARPVVFGVTIIILVYLPILALRGIEGKMFRPMAMTVVFALAGLGRPVREPAPGIRPAGAAGTAGAVDDLRPALQRLRLGPPRDAGVPQRATGPLGRAAGPAPARLPVLDLGSDRLHRPLRHRGAQRRGAPRLRRRHAA
jgi:cobalt-zinc-cadmium resistance protein CzcA